MLKQNEKIITYSGKEIRLRKFNPLDGCYIIQMVLQSFLPEIIEANLGLQRPVQPNKVMSKDEFNDLMLDCMQYVTYLQKTPVVVEIPVLNSNGSLGSEAFTTSDVFMLTLEVLAYNLLDFFTAENMERLQGLLANAVSQVAGIELSQVEEQVEATLAT